MNQICSRFPFVLCRIEPPRTKTGELCDHPAHEQDIALAKEKGVFVINMTIDHRRTTKIAASANVLVLTNVCDPDLLPLIKERKGQGKVTVYEVTGDFGSWQVGRLKDEALLGYIAGSCDALQVTSPCLVERYGHLNPVCRLFRNQIPCVDHETSYRGRDGRKSGMINRLISTQAAEMVEFYRELLLKTNGASNCHNLGGLINTCAAMDGALVNGRHIHLGPTKFELLIREGLASAETLENRETCFRLFRRAAAIEPENYLPYLYGAAVSPQPVETLTKAVELNPSSLSARILLGDELARRGNTWEAIRSFKEAAEVFSDYEIPYSRAASLLEGLGQGDQASLFPHGLYPARTPGVTTAGLRM